MERNLGEVLAVSLSQNLLESSLPTGAAWSRAQFVEFAHDWQGQNCDPDRKTTAGLLWTPSTLFVRFRCHYRELVTFPDSDPDGYRDELWDRDVAEVFLQPDRFGTRHYSEFEVAPNAMWVDLEIFPGGRRRLHSGLQRRVKMDGASRVWTADLAIPMKAIAPTFNPADSWRVNFFRCEGRDPLRWYSSWRPTNTPEPSFHVPEAFAVLRFV